MADLTGRYRDEDWGDNPQRPADYALTLAEAKHAVFAALFISRNPDGQEWMCPPDWTGWSFEAVTDLCIDALLQAGMRLDATADGAARCCHQLMAIPVVCTRPVTFSCPKCERQWVWDQGAWTAHIDGRDDAWVEQFKADRSAFKPGPTDAQVDGVDHGEG